MKKWKYLVLLFLAFMLVSCKDKGTTKDTLYKITFDTTVENIKFNDIEKTEGSDIVLPTVNNEGYRFLGWYLDDVLWDQTTMPNKNITLTAKYEKLYYISFETNLAGVKVGTLSYAENETIVLPNNPKKSGYLFKEWQYNGQTFDLTNMPAQDITLVASWDKTATIYMNLGDGMDINPITDVVGASVDYPMLPEKVGYRFVEWRYMDKPYYFTTMPEEDIYLDAVWEKVTYTSLPAIYINLFDKNYNTYNYFNVDRENYVDCTVSLENCIADYALPILKGQFRGRGNGSWESPKKGYRIKLSQSESLLGGDSSKHWVIIACKSNDFTDVSMLRNYLSYDLGKTIFDGIDYTTSVSLVDIYFNQEYQGVYLLCEQIRDEKGRVDVNAKLKTSNTSFLIEYDAYATQEGELGINYFTVPGLKYPFTVKSPDPDDIQKEGITREDFRKIVSYIQDYVSKAYAAALSKDFTEFTKYADAASFVDMYLLHELTKNTDAGWSSFYLSKTKDGLLKCNAPWDFDASLGLSRGDSSYTGIYVGDTIQTASAHTSSEIFISLYNTPEFKSMVINRWKEVSPKIIKHLEDNYNSEEFNKIKDAMGKNYQKWEAPSSSLISCQTAWKNAATSLIDWITKRVKWLDQEWR